MNVWARRCAPTSDLRRAFAPNIGYSPWAFKKADCTWHKYHQLPDFMTSCLAPPLDIRPGLADHPETVE
jgi:hypothetical protein